MAVIEAVASIAAASQTLAVVASSVFGAFLLAIGLVRTAVVMTIPETVALKNDEKGFELTELVLSKLCLLQPAEGKG